jgi:hypothetical protein
LEDKEREGGRRSGKAGEESLHTMLDDSLLDLAGEVQDSVKA